MVGRMKKKLEKKHFEFNNLDSLFRNKDKKEGKGQYFYSSNERYEGLFWILKKRTFKLN